MPKCSFCGTPLAKGTGKMFVYASGKILHFCTSKWEKNMLQLKRKPLILRWTEAYRTDKGKIKEDKK
jgi:large subunit ribosomal protein L24e